MLDSKVDRETFLRALETVEPGVAPRETIQQATCIVFSGGRVFTFNEEISLSGPSLLPDDFKGAVRADKLLQTLRVWEDEEIRLVADNQELVVSAKQGRRTRKFGLRLEADVLLPIDKIEAPAEFIDLNTDFAEAVQTVAHCAAMSGEFLWTCIHLHPELIEACNMQQLCRWNLQTGLNTPFLIKGLTAKPIVRMGATQLSQTKNWLHFRNNRDFILSSRRYEMGYPSEALSECFEGSGKVITLPKALKEVCEKAGGFSQDNADSDLVTIRLSNDRAWVEAKSPTGWYKECTEVEWKGEPLKFIVSPKILAEIVDKHSEVTVTDKAIKVVGSSYCYCTLLGKADEEE